MSDTNPSEDIDEFIVFELNKDSEGVDEIEDEQLAEIIEVEEDNETKPVVFDEASMDEAMEEEFLEGFEEVEEFSSLVEKQEIIETEDSEEQVEEEVEEYEQKPKIEPTDDSTTEKPPSRYLLFDELVATIVDYDAEETPIVQFAMAAEEDENLPVECGICPDVMHKSKLSKHLKTHRVSGTNRYACIYCDETYRDYKYLAGHARRHMGIRPYVCEPCKLYFSTKQDMRVHNQRRHQAKEHICEICGKTFSQNTMLKRHRESTHEKKLRFACDHCPKAYYKNFALQEHIRNVHMGQRRMLVCPFCGMQCRDAHKMARHRKALHLNQTHYKCHICQEEFTDINYFDAHKRSIQCRNNTRRHMEEQQQQSDGQGLEEQALEDPEQIELSQQQQQLEYEYDQLPVIPEQQLAEEELVYEIILDATEN